MSRPRLGDAADNDASRPLARDSLELGSLASSSHSPSAESGSSSPSGPPSSRHASFDDDDPLHEPKETRRTRMANRSYSVSSAFDFAAPLFPLSATTPGYTALNDSATEAQYGADGGSLERQKTLTYLNGISLVVGLIIGSGIFSSPSQVNKNVGSPGAGLIVWALAGLLAWTGAASYAELGGAIPLNGGAQVYLSKIYGSMMGFLYTWCSVCVIKPGSAAIISIIFGEYIVRAIAGPDAQDISSWINKAVALAALILVVALNMISTKVGTKSADVFMLFKFVAILGVTVTGIVVAVTGASWNGDPSTDWKTKGWFDGTDMDLSRWAVAIYAALWAFDGWDNVNFVAAEFINPTRDLPRVIHTSVPLVIVGYLLCNVSYFLVLPLTVTSKSQTIAVEFGAQVLGPLGSLILALIVSGSSFGSVNATIFTSSRLFYAAAKEGFLPAVIGTLGIRGGRGIRLDRRTNTLKNRPRVKYVFASLCADNATQSIFMTPIASLALNFALTAVYILVGSFSTLVTFYGVASYLFYFIAVLGLLVLRVKEPHLERPYRCWITTPIIFCCVSLFLLSRSFVAEPWTSLSVFPFLLIGLIVYVWRVRPRDNRKKQHQITQTGWQFWKRWGRS